MSTTQSMAQAQRSADKAHHERRVAWLSGAAPTWCDGTPVGPSDRHALLRQSLRHLSEGDGFNHCHCTRRCGS
jgi:hypothetical protein